MLSFISFHCRDALNIQYFLRSTLTSIGLRKGAPDNGTHGSEPG
jgi:hypothetical protein